MYRALPMLHDVVQRLERLLDRRLVVPAMDLVEVDVIRAEPPQAGVDLDHDGLARKALAVGVRAHRVVDLGRDHDLVPSGEVAQGAADDLLARAVGIGVGGVEEVDAELEGSFDERPALFFVERPGMRASLRHPVAHAAEADARDLEAGLSEIDVFHQVVSCQGRGNLDSVIWSLTYHNA